MKKPRLQAAALVLKVLAVVVLAVPVTIAVVLLSALTQALVSDRRAQRVSWRDAAPLLASKPTPRQPAALHSGGTPVIGRDEEMELLLSH